MTVRERPRLALSRLPNWIPVLGVVLLIGELTTGVGSLAMGSAAGPRTVVLRVDGVPGGPNFNYSTPTGTASDLNPALPFVKTVRVRPGGNVTINTFAGTADPVTCSIAVDGKVVSRVSTHGFWDRATCRAKIS